ncbi:MAG: dihydrofolate reductase [Reinekea forsetii]|jgi:dihydrofolate reductase|uniref:Dihydrofolate reductase n=1 Tax=Reinekea forsetii TaxID=1336806 RepID=A0A2K8KPS5_9GAMM|nr:MULTISPECIES: dihydrofolate reductase [Reinekea]ATX75344.1 dihydrofolate reductase [Reinekea forsetii]MDO7641458.1 dihydrofolate reductase [Reinekea forsetii]MDO7644912.1 dihydrofolate reductase [Reinekea forsetii]MDO7675188.1 dihydrofolate reductase [Reinekea forsetii]
MRIAMIWAMANNGVIGRQNKLPWHLPNDLKYFKRLTSGKTVIMGRKTYESIGRPLPNRINIVITRAKDFHAEGIKVVNSLPAALELAAAETLIAGAEEVIVIGGAEIYKLCLPLAERLYVTLVHADVDGDARFPEWDRQAYQEIGREDFSADGPNPYDYSFVVFDKIRH